ncbi:hypothetical protein ACWCY1_33460, partial [Streptomyces goshikiensis]
MRRRERPEWPDSDGTPRSLTEFLERAGVRDRYPHYDLGAAEARLLRVPRALGAAVGRSRRRSAGWSDP